MAGIDRLLRRPEVERITGLKRTAIYSLAARGLFPSPVRLTAKALAWRETELQKWMEGRPYAELGSSQKRR